MTIATNAAKGNADPSNWLPPNEAQVCTYLSDWIAIKARWGLSMDQSEAGRIRNVLTERCPDKQVPLWPETSPSTPPDATAPAPTPTVPQIQPAVEALGTCDPSYPDVCIPPPPPYLDCGDIEFRRFTVVPPDPHEFDGNADGVGCES